MSWSPAELILLALLERSARGPKREGMFALWLTIRVAEGMMENPADGPGERGHRRRTTALEARLSSLVLPAPLRRALTAAVATLRDATPDAARLALTQLVAPVKDTLGMEAANAVRDAARAAAPRGAATR